MKKFLIIISFIFLVSFSACNFNNKKDTFYEVPKIEKTNYRRILGSKYDDILIDDEFMEAVIDFSYATASGMLEERNGMISPLSYYIALSELAELTNGKTQEEILYGLNLDNIDTLRDGNQNLYKKLSYENQISTLKIANSIWLKKDEVFETKPLETLMQRYYASSYEVDFTNSEDTKRIGKWISKNTGGKLGDGEFEDMDPLTMFLLLNTIYFYDNWDKAFDKSENFKAPFRGASADVEYMYQEMDGSYYRTDQYETSSIKFQNGLTMKFVIPFDNKDFNDIINDSNKLKEAFKAKTLSNSKIRYTVPKFSYKSNFDLVRYTKKIGINLVFFGGDFTSLTNIDLNVSEIIHKTFIEIDESGGKAAAFTSIGGVKESAEIIEPINFRIDRPFVYGIYKDDLPIFIGVVVDPNSNKEEIYS